MGTIPAMQLLFLTGDDRARPPNLRHLEAGNGLPEGDRHGKRRGSQIHSQRRCWYYGITRLTGGTTSNASFSTRAITRRPRVYSHNEIYGCDAYLEIRYRFNKLTLTATLQKKMLRPNPCQNLRDQDCQIKVYQSMLRRRQRF